jgi:hypothetical protein
MPYRWILRADAVFLGLASIVALIAFDIRGVYFEQGPLATLGATARHAGVGFIEAHALAFIFAVLFWQAASSRLWHTTGAAVHLLLGSVNLLFWDLYTSTDSVPAGVVATVVHWIFVALQGFAATRTR